MKPIAASPARIALLYPGDRAMRERADPRESRLAPLFAALEAAGLRAEPVVWHDDFAAEVRTQLLRVDAVLVWCNPIEGGRRRDRLDALLRDVAASGVLVSTHPDTVLRLGTKDVLFDTRDLPFGSDVFVEDRVAGFGLQAVNALHPDAPQPGQRLYHGPDLPEFQALRQRLQTQWVGLLRERLGLTHGQLPLLWDCDFMFGEPAAGDPLSFVLCEVNVSSVAPFPPSAIGPLVAALRARLQAGSMRDATADAADRRA